MTRPKTFFTDSTCIIYRVLSRKCSQNELMTHIDENKSIQEGNILQKRLPKHKKGGGFERYFIL